MKLFCPSCERVLYNRRLKRCGFCGAIIPEELRFTPGEIDALDRKMAESEAAGKERNKERELAEKAAAETQSTASIMGIMGNL